MYIYFTEKEWTDLQKQNFENCIGKKQRVTWGHLPFVDPGVPDRVYPQHSRPWPHLLGTLACQSPQGLLSPRDNKQQTCFVLIRHTHIFKIFNTLLTGRQWTYQVNPRSQLNDQILKDVHINGITSRNAVWLFARSPAEQCVYFQ